jgi:3-hydroxyacyl-[acyl-carrier-protein] dehydratase
MRILLGVRDRSRRAPKRTPLGRCASPKLAVARAAARGPSRRRTAGPARRATIGLLAPSEARAPMLTLSEVFDLIPTRRPFRFVDRLLEIDEKHVVGEYTYRPGEFYGGEIQGTPVVPGVIVIETMGQTAHAMLVYLLGLEMSADEVRKRSGVGTDLNIAFSRIVLPGETVRMRADKVFWRGHKLKSRVELTLVDGTPVAHGTIAGIIVA